MKSMRYCLTIAVALCILATSIGVFNSQTDQQVGALIGWIAAPEGEAGSYAANGAQIGGAIGGFYGVCIGGFVGFSVGIPTGPGAVVTGAGGAVLGGAAGATVGGVLGGA
jgi:hypothetical protein